MSTWNFTDGSDVGPQGANNVAGLIKGGQPYAEADNLSSKKNVVATSKGWVRRQQYTDVHGNVRYKEEVLVAAHPGLGVTDGYANSAHLADPDISIMQLSANTADGVGAYQSGTPMTVFVTWNEELVGANLTISATPWAAGGSFTLTANSTPVDQGANNTFAFIGTPATAGSYKIDSGDVTLVSGALVGFATGQTADLNITGAVSNTLMAHSGAVLANGSFTVI